MDERKIRFGSAVLIIKDSTILLGKRNKEPNFGRWVLPGGKIEFGETHIEAAIRESKEELGLDVKILRLAGKGLYHLIDSTTHRIIVYNIAEVVGGELKPSSDISEANFFCKNELNCLDITPVVKEILKDEEWL